LQTIYKYPSCGGEGKNSHPDPLEIHRHFGVKGKRAGLWINFAFADREKKEIP